MPKDAPNDRELLIMAVLINGAKYGRELRDEYERRSGRKLPLGSLYTTLERMKEKGFISSREGGTREERAGYRKVFFELTGFGARSYNAFALAMLGGEVSSNG
jgi:DNA-binding PadR family transcriptional regulator